MAASDTRTHPCKVRTSTHRKSDTHFNRGSRCKLVVQTLTNVAALCPHTSQHRRSSLCVCGDSQSRLPLFSSLLPALEAIRPSATFESAAISVHFHVQRPKNCRLELVSTNILLCTTNFLQKCDSHCAAYNKFQSIPIFFYIQKVFFLCKKRLLLEYSYTPQHLPT